VCPKNFVSLQGFMPEFGEQLGPRLDRGFSPHNLLDTSKNSMLNIQN
jgi:hypothetical protein